MSIDVGCCGFPVAKKQYFQQFKLVEIQQTFYKPPSVKIAKKWREEAPEDFNFSLKAWQVITHSPSSPTYRKSGFQVPQGKEGSYGFFRPSEEVFEAWNRTRGIARVLKAKAVVFQCPASFTPTPENLKNMRYFFANVETEDFALVWEPRGGWSHELVTALCQDLSLVHCLDPLGSTTLRGEIAYFRLHGGPNYRHQYADDELAKLLELNGDKAHVCYVLFNNISMYNDALRLQELIRSSK